MVEESDKWLAFTAKSDNFLCSHIGRFWYLEMIPPQHYETSSVWYKGLGSWAFYEGQYLQDK